MTEPVLIDLPPMRGHPRRQCVHCGSEAAGDELIRMNGGDAECVDELACVARVVDIAKWFARSAEPLRLPKPLYDVAQRAERSLRLAESQLQKLPTSQQREACDIVEDVRAGLKRAGIIRKLREAVQCMDSALGRR